MAKLIYNSVRCSNCGDVLVSHHVHEFKECSCKSVFTDGGTMYIHRSNSAFEEPLDKYDDIPFKEARKWILWGINYTKDNKRLPETKWTPISKLKLNHLEFLVEKKYGSEFYQVMFIKELQYRMLDEEKI